MYDAEQPAGSIAAAEMDMRPVQAAEVMVMCDVAPVAEADLKNVATATVPERSGRRKPIMMNIICPPTGMCRSIVIIVRDPGRSHVVVAAVPDLWYAEGVGEWER